MKFISLENASFSRNQQPILTAIHWQWNDGEQWWIKGGNGAGKSTFLQLVSGQIWPDSSVVKDTALKTGTDNLNQARRVYQFSKEAAPNASLAYVLHQIAMVSTQTQSQLTRHQMSWLGEDIVWSGFLGTHTHSVYNQTTQDKSILAKHQQIFKQVCTELAIAPSLLKQQFLHLSNGQQALILVARALVLKPKCLCIDEIFNGIDAEHIAKIAAALKHQIDNNGLHIMVASHALPESIKALLTHRLTISKGRIINSGLINASVAANNNEAINATSEQSGLLFQCSNAAFEKTEILQSFSSNAPIVQLENIKTYYDNRRILDISAWQLESAQHCLVVGNNGSGKSTFLQLLYGAIKPSTKNSVTINHNFVLQPSESFNALVLEQRQQKMALISPHLHQSYHDYYTIKEVVLSGFYGSVGVLYHQQYTQIMQAKADQYIALFGIEAVANAGVREVSEGQLHRALLARAMMNDSQLFLLDEVDQFLDYQAKQQWFSVLASLVTKPAKENAKTSSTPTPKTIIIASHEMSEANCPDWIKRVIYIDNGQIIKDVCR